MVQCEIRLSDIKSRGIIPQIQTAVDHRGRLRKAYFRWLVCSYFNLPKEQAKAALKTFVDFGILVSEKGRLKIAAGAQ